MNFNQYFPPPPRAKRACDDDGVMRDMDAKGRIMVEAIKSESNHCCFAADGNRTHPRVIHPEGAFRKVWDSLQIMAIAYVGDVPQLPVCTLGCHSPAPCDAHAAPMSLSLRRLSPAY